MKKIFISFLLSYAYVGIAQQSVVKHKTRVQFKEVPQSTSFNEAVMVIDAKGNVKQTHKDNVGGFYDLSGTTNDFSHQIVFKRNNVTQRTLGFFHRNGVSRSANKYWLNRGTSATNTAMSSNLGNNAVDFSLNQTVNPNNYASGEGAFSVGRDNEASGDFSITEGRLNKADGEDAIAVGRQNTASGKSSVSVGFWNTVTGDYGVGLGYKTTVSNNYAVATGYQTTASGVYATAEGDRSTASNIAAHAEGNNTTASGIASHAEGTGLTTASGRASHAEGWSNMAEGDASHAGGQGNTARAYGERAIGLYGTDYTLNNDSTDRLFNIGNGVSTSNRSDALTILKDGTIIAPSLDLSEISNSKSLTTKEYVDNKVNSSHGAAGGVVITENGYELGSGTISSSEVVIELGEVREFKLGLEDQLGIQILNEDGTQLTEVIGGNDGLELKTKEGGVLRLASESSIQHNAEGAHRFNIFGSNILNITTQGIEFPSLDSSSIASPLVGTVIFDSSTDKLSVYDGSAWVPLH